MAAPVLLHQLIASPTLNSFLFPLPCPQQGWNKFTAGFAVGGLSGAAWGYICTQVRAAGLLFGVPVTAAGLHAGLHTRAGSRHAAPFPNSIPATRFSLFLPPADPALLQLKTLFLATGARRRAREKSNPH